MKRSTVVLLLLALAIVIACVSCASSRDETWIGKNVGVTTDSNAAPVR